MSATIELTKTLIQQASITPNDEGCQTIIAERLSSLGFSIQKIPSEEVSNLWAQHGNAKPLFVFAGHTDVVPTGSLDQWTYPPFEPTINNGYLYGRGAQDMKGAVAAMVCAVEQFLKQHPNHIGSIGLLITSAEEGTHYLEGTPKVIEYLQAQATAIDWCIVGEPSSTRHVGDTIRNGRRGSLKGFLTIHGKQGHVAYANSAENPVHNALPALNELITTTWDEGNDYFPATTMQVSNVTAGTGALNVTPGDMNIFFSFRYSSSITFEQIDERTRAILNKYPFNYTLNWELSGKPFLTHEGHLINATRDAIFDVMQIKPILSTAGGTSDGRFIAPTGAEVIELGTCNDRIHKIDERVKLEELDHLTQIYVQLLKNLLS